MNTRFILPFVGAGIMFVPQVARAVPVHYQWSYSKVGWSEEAWGNLTAGGIDESGYLVEISDVSMNLHGGKGDSTGLLDVQSSGWFSSGPKIRADGSSIGLDFLFRTPFRYSEASFIMHDHSEYGGPYEGEVSYMNGDDHIHMHEVIAYSINWKLWQTDSVRVPDGGTTVGLSLLSIIPLTAVHWIRRRRKLI